METIKKYFFDKLNKTGVALTISQLYEYAQKKK